MKHASFSLNLFRSNSDSKQPVLRRPYFWCIIFYSFLCMAEQSFLLPAVELHVRGGMADTFHWVYKQQILILRTRVELKYICWASFKDSIIKATSPEPLSLLSSPCGCSKACVCSLYFCGSTCWFMPLNRQRCGLTSSVRVITEGPFAAYLCLSSVHLDSHWFCLVKNLTD